MKMVETTKGEAYILRTCAADMTSNGNTFTWPRDGAVECPYWRATDYCGNGLHGFLWGEGDGGLADWSEGAVWVVARVTEWIAMHGKVKFPRAEVVFAGTRAEATARIIALGARGAVIGSTLTGGDDSMLTAGDGSTLTAGYRSTLTAGFGSTLTAGYRSTLTAGYRSKLTAGFGSTLTAGYRSTLTAGDGSTLTAGYRSTLTAGFGSTLTAGYRSTLTAGDDSTLTAGDGSTLVVRWWDEDKGRYRLATGEVTKGGLVAGTPYRVSVGKFVAVSK